MTITKNDKAILDMIDAECKANDALQDALCQYIEERGIILPDGVRYTPGIDFVDIRDGDVTILRISLPPVSDYGIDETKFTKRYIRQRNAVAV